MISHAIFASSHLTSARTALSYTPPSTPRFAPPRAALRLSLCPSPCLPPGTPLCIPPELHPAPCTPLFTLLCVALHPPRTALSSTPPPTPRFAPHLALHSHPTPHHALHPAPRPPFPSLSLSQVSSSSRPPISHPRFSILRVPQPSPACGFSRA